MDWTPNTTTISIMPSTRCLPVSEPGTMKISDASKIWRRPLPRGLSIQEAYSPARRRRHGNTSKDLAARRFVVFAQNHDQVGNRLKGDRLSALVSFEGLKLAAAVVLLSPFIPLLFMGEEYGETAPFPYFVSHSDPDLIEMVRRGRREEFAHCQWPDEPPDPQEEATRQSASLDHSLRHQGQHRILYELYKELIKLRNETRAGGGIKQGSPGSCLPGEGEYPGRAALGPRGAGCRHLPFW